MISAIVHTYNEEKNLEQCLSSLTWVDELIVIDMGSIDKTLQIAKKYRAKIYNHPFTGFVEPARNFGLEKAHGDWIIVLDADEELSSNLKTYFLKAIVERKADFYRIPRQNLIFGKWVRHAGWWPDYQIRFFKRGAVGWNEGIHSIPITRGQGVDLEADEKLSIIHHNYENITHYIEKLNRYTGISALQLHKEGYPFRVEDIINKPLKEFINRFFAWEGYKEGLLGLNLSILQAISEVIVYIKLWELNRYVDKKFDLYDLENSVGKQKKELDYWLNRQKINRANLWLRLLLKIKQKFTSYG